MKITLDLKDDNWLAEDLLAIIKDSVTMELSAICQASIKKRAAELEPLIAKEVSAKAINEVVTAVRPVAKKTTRRKRAKV